jgi:type III restriction enzyme
MRVGLFDFQEFALAELRGQLLAMRAEAPSRPQALSFSAPTGAGKTIMMTALFEQILFGAEDFLPQPDAAILWLSDMPELNEQTRLKIEGKSDRIRVSRLRTIDSSFDVERLEGGYVYFINTQKLGTDRLLTSTGNMRQFSIWQTFANTVRAMPDRFYVVIDEAHRGARTVAGNRQAQTLMQRFLLGAPDVGMVPCRMVVGLSATPQRFETLMAGATAHTLRRVAITAEQVRESGLLKQRVLIHHPETPTSAEMSLLQDAARRWVEMERRWADYCSAENEERVYPVLVVQVADTGGQGPTATDLGQAVAAIEHVCDRSMREREMAHTFNDCGDLDIGGRRIRKVEASRIEEDRDIGVVFFKQNLSTGWDCPRAEVMMSFRRAQDYTYIAQLLGRMVRTPLARRIDRDAALNDVHLLLPNFDTQTVTQVVEALRNPEDAPPTAEVGSGRELVTLSRADGMDEAFAAFALLETARVNAARAQSPVRRVIALGRALDRDGLTTDAGPAVKALLVEHLRGEREAMHAAGTLDGLVNQVLTIQIRTLGVDHSRGVATPGDTYSIDTASSDLEARFQTAGRGLSNGLHMDWWQAHAERDSQEVKAELVVLCQQAGVMGQLESVAQAEFDR